MTMINPGVTSWRTAVCLGSIVTFQVVVCKGFLKIHVMNEWRFIDTTTRFHCVILNALLLPEVLNILLFSVNNRLLLHFWSCDTVCDSCPETAAVSYYCFGHNHPNITKFSARTFKVPEITDVLVKIFITLGITGPEKGVDLCEQWEVYILKIYETRCLILKQKDSGSLKPYPFLSQQAGKGGQ